jgi:hypothetical protein
MNPLNYFWTWFNDNQKHFLNYLQLSPKLQKHYTFWLEWHLNYYSKGVNYVMVFSKRKDQKAKLIITANGNHDFFDKVEAVVAAAPRFSNWEIIAFVQPSAKIDEMMDGLDKPFIFQDISLKASEVKFEPIEYENTKKIDMIIYLKYQTIQADYKDLMQVVYIMVESILGEKYLHENINFVQLAQLTDQNTDCILELYDLQLFIEELNMQRLLDR